MSSAQVFNASWKHTNLVPCCLGNCGFFVRHDDEWDWLRSFLTIERIKLLLGAEEYKGKPIDRFELPGIRAVHFLLHDHLDRGYNACSNYDTLGKSEWQCSLHELC